MTSTRRLRTIGEPASGDVVIIRPLLGTSKAEILNFLHGNGFAYRIDRSNEDTSLLRNWVRLDLMPQLQRRFGVKLAQRLPQQAAILREENRLLERLAGTGLAAARTPGGLNRMLFLEQDGALQRLMLRLWLEEARGHLRGVDFDHIESLLRFIEEGPPQGRLALPGGWELVREYERLKLENLSSTRKRVCYSYDLHIGQDLKIHEAGLTIHSARGSSARAELPCSLMEAVFDLESLSETLTVRNFRRGDRFQPLGMEGHKKLKELFIDKKITLSVRASLPLLIMAGEVLWIPGYGRSNVARIGPQTKAVLHLKAVRF
jgi:tRNA(Ile)-lysidine synthase